jgi:NADPH:quinone reductase
MKAIRVHQTGGPETLRWEDVDVAAPGAGEVLLRQTAIGLNYIDVYYRAGRYPPPGLPFTPGLEGAGIVEEVGPDVRDLKPGTRVGYASAPLGAYAEWRVMPAHRLVPLADDIDDRTAAAVMLKGMTAEYLLHRTIAVQRGDTILFHAAAGGVGLLACQWARALGATVIGTVSTEEKAALAAAHGCHHVIVYTREPFVERVKQITGGQGVRVVYDSVGKDTFLGSLDCLRPLGMMVSFGQSSGPIPPFDLGLLSAKGSLFLTRPALAYYTSTPDDLLLSARSLFQAIRSGTVLVEIRQTYRLRDAETAHRDLEARRTSGSSLLLPS